MKAEKNKKRETIRISGFLFPIAWDTQLNVLSMAIRSDLGIEYAISKRGRGRLLNDFNNHYVTVSGSLGKNKGCRKFIHVKEWNISLDKKKNFTLTKIASSNLN